MAAEEVVNAVKVEVEDLMIMMIDVITAAQKETIEVVDGMMTTDVVDDRVDTTADMKMTEPATAMDMPLVHQVIIPVLLHLHRDDNLQEWVISPSKFR